MLKSYWARLSPTTKRVLVICGCIVVVLAIVTALSAIGGNEKRKSGGKQTIGNVLTDSDPRAVGLDALNATQRQQGKNLNDLTRNVKTLLDGATQQQELRDGLKDLSKQVAFHGLVQALEADIVDTGSELASMGYKIIEAYPSEEKLIRRFLRRNFRVEVYKFSDERYDIFGEATSTDELDLAIQDVLDGKIEALGLEVRIEMLDDDGEEISTLAMSVFEGFSRDSSISGLCPHSRSLVREAIVEARETYTKLLKPRLRQAA